MCRDQFSIKLRSLIPSLSDLTSPTSDLRSFVMAPAQSRAQEKAKAEAKAKAAAQAKAAAAKAGAEPEASRRRLPAKQGQAAQQSTTATASKKVAASTTETASQRVAASVSAPDAKPSPWAPGTPGVSLALGTPCSPPTVEEPEKTAPPRTPFLDSSPTDNKSKPNAWPGIRSHPSAFASAIRPGGHPKASDAIFHRVKASDDNDEVICRKAAAAMVKYKKFERVEHCSAKGVDSSNRDGAKLNISDIKTLASFIHKIGCDPKELARSVTVWLGNGPLVESVTGTWWDEEIAWNMEMCAVSDQWPVFDDEVARSMTQTTVIGSHGNYVSRCWYYGCETDDPELADASGHMSMAKLRVIDAVWADHIERGSMTLVLDAAIRGEPDLLAAVGISDNLKHGADLTQHSLQKLLRMHKILGSEQNLVSDSQRDLILRKYTATLGRQASDTDLQEARCYFNCASRLGDGSALAKLSQFRSSYLTSAKARDAPPEFYGDCAQMPASMPRLRVATIEGQLSCPEADVIGGVCGMIKKSDLESVKDNRALAKDAQAAELFLRTYHKAIDDEIMLSPAQKFKAEVVSNIHTCRALFKKKTPYPTFASIAVAAWPDEAGKPCPWSTTSLDGQDQDSPSSSQTPVSDSPLRPALIPTGPDGDVRGDFLCRDKGFDEEVYVRLILRTKGQVEEVWQVKEYLIKDSNVEVRLKALTPGVTDMAVDTDRLQSDFELTKKPKEIHYLLSEQFMPMYCPIPSKTKALYTLAMHKAFEVAVDDWKVVDIMTSPRTAVLAHVNLKKGRQFLVVSPSVLFEQEASKLLSPAFCVDDALGAGSTKGGTYVLPAAAIHRESAAKVSITSQTQAPKKNWQHFVNVASMIRIMTREQAEKAKAVLNCKLGVVHFPVMLSGFGSVQEHAAGIPVMTTMLEAKPGEELIAEADPFIYHMPRAKVSNPRQQTNAGLLKEPARKKVKVDG